MPKKKYTREYVADRIRTAALVDAHLPKAQRQIISNSWPATIPFHYDWLHLLTEKAAPILYAGNIESEKEFHMGMKMEIFKEVTMRWLPWIDSTEQRELVWMFACNGNKSEIARRLGMSYRTAYNRCAKVYDIIIEKLNESGADSE
jgi:hypothetical protein